MQEPATPETHQGCARKPTAQLYKDGIAILVWAFDAPEHDSDELNALVAALGMDDVTEIVPVPGTDGWELVHHSGPTYSLDKLVDVYVNGNYPEDPTDPSERTEGPEGLKARRQAKRVVTDLTLWYPAGARNTAMRM